MDCVYRKVLPSRRDDFKDGMRQVFDLLQQSQLFDELEILRNEIAHGNLDLLAATHKVIANLDLTRKALQMMILRIIKCDKDPRDRIIAQSPYKGSVVTNIKFSAKVKSGVGNPERFDGHPELYAVVEQLDATPNGETVTMKPIWGYKHSNLEEFRPIGMELRGDPGANVRVNEVGIIITPQANESDK